MTLTMYYVRGVHKKVESHSNIPAEDSPGAYSIFKQHYPDSIVVEMRPLFTFEHENEPEPLLVTQ